MELMTNQEQTHNVVRTSITVDPILLKKFQLYCKQQKRSVSAQLSLYMEAAIEEAQMNQNDRTNL